MLRTCPADCRVWARAERKDRPSPLRYPCDAAVVTLLGPIDRSSPAGRPSAASCSALARHHSPLEAGGKGTMERTSPESSFNHVHVHPCRPVVEGSGHRPPSRASPRHMLPAQRGRGHDEWSMHWLPCHRVGAGPSPLPTDPCRLAVVRWSATCSARPSSPWLASGFFFNK